MTINPDRVRRAFDAAAEGELRTVQLMIRAGVPLDFVCEDRRGSLLTHAATYGQAEVFLWLAEQGADPTIREPAVVGRSDSVIECACRVRYSPVIVNWILDNSRPDESDLGNALQSIASKGDAAIDVVKMLLAAGADPNFCEDDHDTPLYVAVTSGAEQLALGLLEAGGSPLFRSRGRYQGEFGRKTAFEVARKLGLETFCTESVARFPELRKKPARVSRPGTIAECWKVISAAIQDPSVSLPPGLDSCEDQLKENLSLESLDELSSLRTLADAWSLHNGSAGVGLFPVPSDVSYAFCSLADAVESRRIELDVAATDSPGEPTGWTTWIPVADNGGGDYLVLDTSEASDGRVSRYSHETNRLLKVAPSLLALFQKVAVEILKDRLYFDAESQTFV